MSKISKYKDEIIQHFITENIDIYPNYLREDFYEKIYRGYTTNNDIINQIYAHLNLVNIKETDYYEFYKILNSNFDIEKEKIVEVAAGKIPVLAKLIGLPITIIDPESISIYENTSIIKAKFVQDTDIENYSLIIAYRPCGATETILKKCLNENKNFCIALCNCSLYPGENYKGFSKKDWDTTKWHEYLNYIIEIYNRNHHIEVIKMNNEYAKGDTVILGKIK